MNILVVSPDFPFPPNHGGRVDIWTRLKTFAAMGLTIDLAVTSKLTPTNEALAEVKKYVRTLWLLKRHNHWWHLLSYSPLQSVSRAGLAKLSLEPSYDLVWLEGEYVEAVLRNPSLRTKQVHLRLQNDEALYFRELASSTSHPLKRLYYQSEAYKLARLSNKLYHQVAGLYFISSTELDHFKQQYPHLARKAWLLPAPLSKTRFDPPCLGQKVIFVGSLFIPNNQEAITWYLQNVHSKIQLPGYSLMIAGNTRGESLAWLYRLAQPYANIEIHDSPADLEPLYKQAGVFINPMHSGAGVKLKTLEAIQHGLALVSTSKGIEGTGLRPEQHCLLADEAKKFALHVERLLGDLSLQKQLILRGQQFLGNHYDHQAILEKALNLSRSKPPGN